MAVEIGDMAYLRYGNAGKQSDPSVIAGFMDGVFRYTTGSF